MKAPIRMYILKPVVNHNFAVEIPKCMYKSKNIHTATKVDGSEDHVPSPTKLDIFDQVKQFLKNCQKIPEMAELEAKQSCILEQLSQLKKQIYTLKCDLNIQGDSSSKDIPSAAQCFRPVSYPSSLPESLVISANPTNPPFSLGLLQRLLQNQVGLTVTSYLHSSVASLPAPANELKQCLANFKPPTGVPFVNIRLIWKNISSNAEMLLLHTPISGEVNLLRFLSRLGNTNLSYDSDINALEIDSLLDQCYVLVRAKTKIERASILQTFNKSLGKSEWLIGESQAGIADLAAYSAIRQCLNPSELGVHLTKWYQRCEALVSS